jgi:ketosteroid isomerase-like protein
MCALAARSSAVLGCDMDLPLLPTNDFLDGLLGALNSHDPGQLAALFAEDYRSTQPVHPGREFEGRAQVLENWTSVFEGVPDFSARLVSGTQQGDTVWSEWDWSGAHTDGTPFAMRGIIHLILRDGLIAEGRLFMEPVDQEESSIEAAVKELYQP